MPATRAESNANEQNGSDQKDESRKKKLAKKGKGGIDSKRESSMILQDMKEPESVHLDSTAIETCSRSISCKTSLSPQHSPPHIISKAVQHCSTNQMRRLFQVEQDKLEELLLIAAEKGNEQVAYLLLHQGIIDRTRCQGRHGFSPLHHAAARGHLSIIKLLLVFKWDVNLLNHFLESPLHLASFSGHETIVEHLLASGARADLVTKDGETALFYAARKDHHRIVRVLLQHDCDPLIKNRFGDVAQDEATNELTKDEFQQFANLAYSRNSMIAQRQKRMPGRGAGWDGWKRLTCIHRQMIFSFLDARSLCMASQVCSSWHITADTPSLWKRLGVSKWQLMLNTTMGLGHVAPMTMLRLIKQSSTRPTSPSRPTSCTIGIGSRVLQSQQLQQDHRLLSICSPPRPHTARHYV